MSASAQSLSNPAEKSSAVKPTGSYSDGRFVGGDRKSNVLFSSQVLSAMFEDDEDEDQCGFTASTMNAAAPPTAVANAGVTQYRHKQPTGPFLGHSLLAKNGTTGFDTELKRVSTDTSTHSSTSSGAKRPKHQQASDFDAAAALVTLGVLASAASQRNESSVAAAATTAKVMATHNIAPAVPQLPTTRAGDIVQFSKEAKKKCSATVYMKKLPDGFQPGPGDVICKRGSVAYEHNAHFRELLQQYLGEYSKAPCKLEKSLIVTQILERIRSASPDGGFVREENGTWFEIGDALSRERVGAQFRDMLHTQYRSSTKAKRRRKMVETTGSGGKVSKKSTGRKRSSDSPAKMAAHAQGPIGANIAQQNVATLLVANWLAPSSPPINVSHLAGSRQQKHRVQKVQQQPSQGIAGPPDVSTSGMAIPSRIAQAGPCGPRPDPPGDKDGSGVTPKPISRANPDVMTVMGQPDPCYSQVLIKPPKGFGSSMTTLRVAEPIQKTTQNNAVKVNQEGLADPSVIPKSAKAKFIATSLVSADEHAKQQTRRPPRSPLNAFKFYEKDTAPRIRQRFPVMPAKEVNKKCSEQWRQLCPAAKTQYLEMAESDTDRYHRELCKFQDSRSGKGASAKAPKQEGQRVESQRASSQKPRSPVICFFQEHADEIFRYFPEFSYKEALAEACRRFNNLTPVGKQKYVNMAEKDKARCKRELAMVAEKVTSAPVAKDTGSQ